MNKLTCILPGGYVDEKGQRHRRVEFVSLSGTEEEILAYGVNQPVSAFVTTILSRCVLRIGLISPVSEEVARALLVADRQYLLLRLREATFGDRVQATILCTWPSCGKEVDIDFSTGDVPVRELEEKGPTYGMELSSGAAVMDEGKALREVVFRLPNGGDQEEIAPVLHEDEARAQSMLLGRCIQKIGPSKKAVNELIGRLSPMARMEIERRMARVAPHVELNINANCPECGHDFTLPFDLHEFFFGELRISGDLLYREVHYLAYHYHWSERDIIDMSREKRRMYIDVLADEIERMNSEL